jgi:deoxyribodipyrimidine photolyase-related protein
MSNYCAGCQYDVKATSAPGACPFNLLYWDFLARHQEELKKNPRMGLVYRSMDRMDPERLAAIRSQAEAFLDEFA